MEYPKIKISYNTSEDDVVNDFYLPCLKWADRFERGVGYFTTGWIEYNAEGMAAFVSHGGKAKWITSPIIDEKDLEIIEKISDAKKEKFLERLIDLSVDRLKDEMKKHTRNLFAWMIYDNVLEIRFAIPVKGLANGDFHDKFGNFYNDENVISFVGSINDSKKGFSNYEGIMVFPCWNGADNYSEMVKIKFKRLWENTDDNILCYKMTEAVKNKIFKLRNDRRPYTFPQGKNSKWSHQEEAMECFLSCKNGILEMATGTGKTYTAIKIARFLFDTGTIVKAVICTYGNDLLEQWYKETLLKLIDLRIFRYYETDHKELTQFLLCKRSCILILSLNVDRVLETIRGLMKYGEDNYNKTLWIYDEVHRLGAKMLRTELQDKIRPFQYRLGLSATPIREFDHEGTQFIKDEIGNVIYEFGLQTAIQRGILCEFDYIPLEYELTELERKRKRDIIASFEAKKANGEYISEEVMYRELSKVNKISVSKLPLFEQLLQKRPELLDKCIIFVETMEYGKKVQNILTKFIYKYHTYYAEDQKKELQKFARGEIDCLLTCKKISEGVDIKAVKNIFLFSSDRGKLVTTQRIGRSLRVNPDDPDKRANVVDFICLALKGEIQEEIEADRDRREWLSDLANTRRIK